MSTRFVFIRHAEAKKNLKDIVGGDGTSLTEKGINQARTLFKTLSELIDDRSVKLFSSPLAQAIETANIVSEYLEVQVNVSDELTPSDMGILTGLTQTEIKDKYPNEYNILMRWRRKEIDVSEFKIPGMKEPSIFWNQIMKFIDDNRNDMINIVVCTRSIMVLIINYISGNKPIEGGNYQHYDVNNCEVIAFDISDDFNVDRVK